MDKHCILPHFTGHWVQAARKMDCSHYECVRNKQYVIEKLHFMLSRLVNESLCVVKRGDCRVLVCVVRGDNGISWIIVCKVIPYLCGILFGLLLHITTTSIKLYVWLYVSLCLFDCVDVTSNGPVMSLFFFNRYIFYTSLFFCSHVMWICPNWFSKSSILALRYAAGCRGVLLKSIVVACSVQVQSAHTCKETLFWGHALNWLLL